MTNTTATSHRRARVAVATSFVVGSIVLAAPTAHAVAPNQERFEIIDSGSFSDCGYPIDYDATGTISLLFKRVVGTDGQYETISAHVDVTTVFTNADSGEWFSFEEKLLDGELRARVLPDGTLEVLRNKVGQAITIKDSTGRVVARDRGLERQINVFDENGFVDGELVGFFGPHPLSGQDFCEVANALIG